MPDYASLGVRREVKSADHDFTLFEIFANCESEQVLVDLSFQVQLLNEKRSSLASSHWSKSNDSIASHP